MLVILGPTAAGKTDLGIKLAKEKKGAVVSADSRQLYTGMDTGTAKPEFVKSRLAHGMTVPDVVDGVEHYLLNVRDPDEQITLAEWQQAAFEVIDKVIARGKYPLLVGGTMLYLDSIIFNYDIPRVGKNKELRERLEKRTVENLLSELIAKDPKAKEFIQPRNKRRIIRALEVIEATGRPFSEQRKKRAGRYDIEIIGIFPGWNELRDRITKRTKQMIDNGLIGETKQLQEQFGKDLPLLRTMNYKQAAAVLDGQMTKSEAIEEMIRANMRYAKRQMSWWRRRKDIKWLREPFDMP